MKNERELEEQVRTEVEAYDEKAKLDGFAENREKMRKLFDKAQEDMRGKDREHQFTYFLCAMFGLFTMRATDEQVRLAYLIEENREK